MMKKTQTGFTIIELVTVIILLGILAVYVLPKFNGSSSFEAYTYRTQLISALRLTQQRAMQYTATTHINDNGSTVNMCHHLVFDVSGARYGVPNRTDCSIETFPNGWQPDSTGLIVDSNHQVTFEIQGQNNPSAIGFNHLGVPTKNCLGGCVINVIGADETVQIKIAAQGFIYAI